MAGPTPEEFTVESMAAAGDRTMPSANFVMNLAFPEHLTYETNTVRIDEWTSTRIAAPFAQPNGHGTPVQGVSKDTREYRPPTMKPKMVFEGSRLLNDRIPGESVQVMPGQTRTAAIREMIARDLAEMRKCVDNRLEWMCCKALTPVAGFSDGTGFTYAPADETVQLYVNYAVQDSHLSDISADAAANWLTGTTAGRVLNTFQAADEAISEDGGCTPTHCILGKKGAQAFMADPKVAAVIGTYSGFTAGQLGLNLVQGTGARFLGIFNQMQVWAYLRTVKLPETGATSALITSEHAVFISVTPEAQMGVKYAGIPDAQAILGGNYKAERYAKAWDDEEAGVWNEMLITRPLPVIANEDSVYIAKVVP